MYSQIENRRDHYINYEENVYFWTYCYILLILYPTHNNKKKNSRKLKFKNALVQSARKMHMNF